MTQTNACAGPVFKPDFGIFHDISDDSYRRGYNDGNAAGQLSGYADGQQAGYEAGQLAGYEAGRLSGEEQGKQAEYDRFWDAFQQNGQRTLYMSGFAGEGWTDETFKPKYTPIKPTGNDAVCDLFHNSKITTLENGVIDFSESEGLYNTFRKSAFVKLPRVNMSKSEANNYAFGSCSKLEQIECIISSDVTVYASNTFYHDYVLKEIRFEGSIAKSVSFQWSNLLSDASVQSIIEHLKDLTGKTAQTLTFHADVGEKLTDVQRAAITAKNWTLVY